MHFMIRIASSQMLLAASLAVQAGAPADPQLPYTPSLDPAAMDRVADPCVDFYQFACGGWIRNNPIPPDQSSWSTYGKMQDDNRVLLRGLLEGMSRGGASRTPNQQKIGDYYAACMAEADLDRRGAAPLVPQLEAIASISSVSDLARVVGGSHRSMLVLNPILFSLRAEQDARNSSDTIASVDQSGLGQLVGGGAETPVAMPVPAVADAVSKGTIDGFVLPWEVIPAFKLQELVKYHTETDASRPAMYSAGFIFAMNQARYDSLPADLKKVIDNNSGAALSKQIGKIWDASQTVGRKAATDRGNNFIQLSAAETDNWMKASAPLYDEWIIDMDKRGLPGKQMLDDARGLLVKYKK